MEGPASREAVKLSCHLRLLVVVGRAKCARRRVGTSATYVKGGARLAKALRPKVASGTALGRAQEVLERHVDEGPVGIGEELAAVPQVAVDLKAPPSAFTELRGDLQRGVDVHRLEEPDREAGGDRGEAVPGGEQPAGLVECGCDEAAVGEPGRRLVLGTEREGCVVGGEALLLGRRERDPVGVVATTPAARVVVGRDLQRMPPRSKCALKKFAEPAVAIAAEAEISSASVAAATIWAKR